MTNQLGDKMTEETTKKRSRKKPSENSTAVTYVLRSNNADMSSYGGFVWPESGRAACPDWEPRPVCGGGLHGLLMGDGDQSLLNWNEDAKWLVVAVNPEKVVKIDDAKVKFPEGEVVFVGDMRGASAYIVSKGADAGRVPGGTATAGYNGTATAGNHGTATAANHGTATAGDSGTATAGNHGTATAGDSGTATAGKDGIIVILRWNGKRYKPVVLTVGEDGIKPNTPYRLDDDGKPIEVMK